RGRARPQAIVGAVPAFDAEGKSLARLPGLGRLTTQLAILRQPAVMGGFVVAALAVLFYPRRTVVRVRRPRRAIGAREHLTIYLVLAGIAWLVVTAQSIITTSPIEGHYTLVE